MSNETTKTYTKVIDGTGTQTPSTEALLELIRQVEEKIQQIIQELEDIESSINSSLGKKFEH